MNAQVMAIHGALLDVAHIFGRLNPFAAVDNLNDARSDDLK